MKIIKKTGRRIAEKWKAQYCKNGKWEPTAVTGNTEAVYHAILAAADDFEKIDAAIGNSSWTSVRCSECEEAVLLAIKFEGNCDSVTICQDCIEHAANFIVAVTV